MAATFALIASYTVSGSSTSQFSFMSIPNTYTDLCLMISDKVNVAGTYDGDKTLQYNSQTATNSYTGTFAYINSGTGSNSLPSQSTAPQAVWWSAANSSNGSFYSINWTYISDYNNVNITYRPYYGIGAAGSPSNGIITFGSVAPYVNEAVTSLTLKHNQGNNLVADSTYYLYGIKNS
jgi:hypothetical protein